MKTKPKKKVFRKKIKRKKGKTTKPYFHEGTSEAIKLFQQEESQEEREKLYMKEIFPAFNKLVENLIFLHNFQGLHCSQDDLKSDCVSSLYEAINKFDFSKGSKPFSYFNVVAKNWLIIRSKSRATNLQRNISIDDRESISIRDLEVIETNHIVKSQDDQFEEIEFIKSVKNVLLEIQSKANNNNEKKCINTIIHIFENVDGLDFLEKRAVFKHIRELSGLNPKQLTTTIASLKKHYRELRSDENFGMYC